MQLIWIMTTDNFSIFNKYKEKNKLVSLTPAYKKKPYAIERT